MRVVQSHRAIGLPALLLALILWGIGQGALSAWPDVPTGHWARTGLESMTARGVLAGYPDGRFGGSERVTRYELAAMLARAWPLRTGPQPASEYGRAGAWQDVPGGHWARASLVWLVDGIGLLGEWPGVLEGHFRGIKPIDRFELAVAVAAMLPIAAGTGDDGDGQGPAWARAAVRRVLASGVLVGFPDGQFHGERLVSRYEAALAFHKALQVPAPEPVAAADLAIPAGSAIPVGPSDDRPSGVAGPSVTGPGSPPGMTPGGEPGLVEATPRPFNLPRVSLSFLPEYLSELADPAHGEATGWAMASSAVQADWADGPLTLSGLWRIAQYGLKGSSGSLLARQDYQLSGAAGYRWRWGEPDRQGEIGVFGLGTYLGRRSSGSTVDDLLGMDLQAFGLGLGTQLRWPVAPRLVAVARAEYLPVLGAQFGPTGAVSGQLGLVQTVVGLDWYLDRLSLGLGYRLRYLYDGQQHYSQWANGMQLKAGLAF